jgi:hypothetical protein
MQKSLESPHSNYESERDAGKVNGARRQERAFGALLRAGFEPASGPHIGSHTGDSRTL